jgi:hypothetical protein
MHQKCTTALSTTNSLLAEITQGCIGMHSVRHQMIKSDALDKRLYTVAKHSKTSGKNCEENHCRQVKDVKIDDFVEFSKCVLHCWTDRAMGMSPTDDDTRDTCDTCFEFMASVCRIDGSAACTNVLSCDVVCCKCKKGHLVSVCARVKFLYHYSLFLKDD